MKSKNKTLIVFIAAASWFTSTLFAQLNTNVQQALYSEGLTEQRSREILAASVPVGGIIPYVGGLPLPANWQVCDGSDLRLEADATLKTRMSGKTPALVGRVPIGVATNSAVGIMTGTNRIELATQVTSVAGAHSHTVNSHNHDLPSRTGLVAGDNPGRTQPQSLKNERSDSDWLIGHSLVAEGRGGTKGSTITTSEAQLAAAAREQARQETTHTQFPQFLVILYLPALRSYTSSGFFDRLVSGCANSPAVDGRWSAHNQVIVVCTTWKF